MLNVFVKTPDTVEEMEEIWVRADLEAEFAYATKNDWLRNMASKTIKYTALFVGFVALWYLMVVGVSEMALRYL